MKQCPRCITVKSSTSFYPDRHKKSGLSVYCIACVKQRDRGRVLRGEERERASRARARKRNDPAYIQRERERRKAWKQANPSIIRDHKVRRRLTAKQQTPAWADAKEIRRIYRAAKAIGYHVDHIVPLKSPVVCGLHWEGNLQLLPPAENMRKANKLISTGEVR